AEFDRLYPDVSPDPFGLPPAPPADRTITPRLTLATETPTEAKSHRRATPTRWIGAGSRIAAAFVDVGGVVLVASVASQVTHLNLWIAISVVGFCYQSLSTLCLGQSLAAWWLAAPAPRSAVGGLLEARATPRSATSGGVNWRSEWSRRTQAWAMRGDAVWRASAAMWRRT